MIVYGFVDKTHIKKEREKARVLRRSPWWKQKKAKGLCHYCEQSFSPEELTMDHKIPLSRGGKTSKGNVVTSCEACNQAKKSFTPAEVIMASSPNTESDS